MQINTTIREQQALLLLAGCFDFNTHRDFRRAYDPVLEDPAVKELHIDFARVDYLDSSALGMLLILRDKVGEKGKTIVLTGLQGTIKQVLDIANFGKLFAMRD